jgi:cell division transport system permease protein
MVLGMLAVLLMPRSSDETASFLTGLGFEGLHWLLPLLIPPLAAGVAYLATRLAARRTLEGLT